MICKPRRCRPAWIAASTQRGEKPLQLHGKTLISPSNRRREISTAKFAAYHAQQKKAEGGEWLPSLKPLLSQHGPRRAVALGNGRQQTLLQLLSGYLRRLREDLATHTNLPPSAEIDQTWIAVPANADSNINAS